MMMDEQYYSQYDQYLTSLLRQEQARSGLNPYPSTQTLPNIQPNQDICSSITNSPTPSNVNKVQSLFKKITVHKVESARNLSFSPDQQFQTCKQNGTPAMKKSKTCTDRPVLQFKTKDHTNKRSEPLRIDSISNALQMYIERKERHKSVLKECPQTDSSPNQTVTQQHIKTPFGSLFSPVPIKKSYKLLVQQQMIEEQPRVRGRALTMQPIIKLPCLSDFAIGRRLGKGKSGEVFLVRNKKIGMLCAMKVISKDFLKQNNLQSQLAREIMLQLYLNHSNIVAMYGVFSENNKIYLLMQPCLDGHLFSQMKRRKRFDEEDAASVVREVLEGVDMMHRFSIIHRDLKPQNIVRHEGVSKISDFGWAVYSPDHLRDTFCGTPLYMSPELLEGQQYSQSVDLWAVGMLTYELLVGRLPFKVNRSHQLTRIVTDQVKFPEQIAVSETSKDFVLTILKKNPVQRCDIDTIFSHPFLNKLRQS